MNSEEIREYCLSKPGVIEDFPFDEETLVFKVMGKIFLFLPLERGQTISLKFPPDDIPELQDQYPAVIPAYHLNKKHWSAVILDGSIPPRKIAHWINQSYDLVVSKMPKKLRTALKEGNFDVR
jgi:predicted DNA-binding protein (MmcQ/YjbR family)